MENNKFPSIIKVIVVVWILIVVICEVLVFRFQAAHARSDGKNILIVSDPQLTDNFSYSFLEANPFGFISRMVYFFSDLYMKKNFLSLLLLNSPNVDAIVFNGDLMDAGRGQNNKMWIWEYERYQTVFSQPKGYKAVPTYNVSGNHDIGFGDRTKNVIDRFKSKFGERLNYEFNVGGVKFLVINSLYLEQISYRHYEEADRDVNLYDMNEYRNEALNFINKYVSKDQTNTVLFSHVPLFREDYQSCGAYQDSRRTPMRQGRGISYQNLLQKHTSDYILKAIKPKRVFSGDDHENCEYVHKYDGYESIEVTVGSFSFLQGTVSPSYGMINIKDGDISYRSIFMPRQWYIYLFYLFCVPITTILLIIFKIKHHVKTFSNKIEFGEDLEVGTTSTCISPNSLNNDVLNSRKKLLPLSIDYSQTKREAPHTPKQITRLLTKDATLLLMDLFKSILLVTTTTFVTFVFTLLYWYSI
ncbi:ethanolamine phosphate phosphodiesterase [Acrasis kona]|uniref:Ethanolamine phosphate phosphodiesterase n=1 Tax=Acrasis kona TaxID=1008807 RepID=A0AAW2ZSW3_9EUKA